MRLAARAEQAQHAEAKERGDHAQVRIVSHQLLQAADVVRVRMGQPEPAQVARIHDGLQRGHELVVLGDQSGVDERGSRA
jgi:hypothetical protein